eukprot:3140502-Rhodomonas_salina.2
MLLVRALARRGSVWAGDARSGSHEARADEQCACSRQASLQTSRPWSPSCSSSSLPSSPASLSTSSSSSPLVQPPSPFATRSPALSSAMLLPGCNKLGLLLVDAVVPVPLWSYARPTPCPVVTSAMLLPGPPATRLSRYGPLPPSLPPRTLPATGLCSALYQHRTVLRRVLVLTPAMVLPGVCGPSLSRGSSCLLRGRAPGTKSAMLLWLSYAMSGTMWH